MPNLNLDVRLAHFYKILAGIYAFTLNIVLGETKNGLKLSVEFYYGNEMVNTRKVKSKSYFIETCKIYIKIYVRHTLNNFF